MKTGMPGHMASIHHGHPELITGYDRAAVGTKASLWTTQAQFHSGHQFLEGFC